MFHDSNTVTTCCENDSEQEDDKEELNGQQRAESKGLQQQQCHRDDRVTSLCGSKVPR